MPIGLVWERDCGRKLPEKSCQREPYILLNITIVSSRGFKAFSTELGAMKLLYLLIHVILLISQAMAGKPYSASIFLVLISSASSVEWKDVKGRAPQIMFSL